MKAHCEQKHIRLKVHILSYATHWESSGAYLGVSVEHFDPLGGDEEVHLYHWLGLTLRGL